MNSSRHSGERAGPTSPPARGIETFRRLDEPPVTPSGYGVRNDPRYPSPRLLRWTFAFTVDWLLHAGPMIAVLVVLTRDQELADKLPHASLWAFASWPVLSIIDRIIVQGAFQSTIGKALFGLVAIRPEDGGRPGFGRLTKVWFRGISGWAIVTISVVGNYSGGSGRSENRLNFVLPAVRRRDTAFRVT